MRTFKNCFGEFEFKTHYIDTQKEAKKILQGLDTGILYGLDIETAKVPAYKEHERSGLDPRLSKIRLLQIYDGEKSVYVFDMFVVDQGYDDDLTLNTFLSKARFVAHNAKFELAHLSHAGHRDMNVGCSMLLSQLVHGAEHSPYEEDPADEDNEDQTGLAKYRKSGHSLDAVTARLFGIKVSKTMQVSDWAAPVLSAEQITYASLDAVLTYKVAKALEPKVKEYKMVKHYKLLKQMQHVVVEMEKNGLPVDWDYHAGLMVKWKDKSEKALAACKPHFGDINIRSGKQMGAWLVEYLKDKPKVLKDWPKTKKGSLAFGRPVLGPYTHLPPIAALLDYKKWAKLIDTYGQSLVDKKHPITGRLHCSYTLGETRTGRLSSRDPNAQNFPHDKEFRALFKAPKGFSIIAGDYSMIELRIQAELSQDPVMLKVFKEGGDIYKTTASSFLGIPVDKITDTQRTVGKVLALSLGFGMGATKLGVYALTGFNLKRPQTEWDLAHKTYHSLFHVYSRWCDKMRARAKKLGYIETLLGKRRKLEEDEMYTTAPSTIVQGSAAELMMTALIIAVKKIGNLGTVLATIHDEILVLAPSEIAPKVSNFLTESMQESMKILFPNAVSFNVAKVQIGQTWAEAK